MRFRPLVRVAKVHENRSAEAAINVAPAIHWSGIIFTSKGEIMRIKLLALAVSAAITSVPAFAADLFTVDGTVTYGTTQTQSYSFKTAEDALDAFKNENLQSRFSNYTDTAQANLTLGFRGLPMAVSYTANSTTLVFSVPSLGITQSFTGTTRDASQEQFSDFMKKNGGDILNRIMKKLAEVSPDDPVAGNPNSLMGQMVANDFANGFSNVATNIGAAPNEKVNNLIGIGARFTSLRQNGNNSNNFAIPFSYTVRSDIDPRRQLIFNLPVSYTEVEGAKAYSAGFGASYRFPMNDAWTLTPSLNYGLAGSRDLGAVGQAVGASIASTYIFTKPSYDIAIGNMVGHYRTLKLTAGDYSYNPGIANTVFRNGVMYSRPVTAFGKKMSIEYSLIDTRYTGTKLYNQGYDELGVTLGTNKRANSARSFFRAGASYLHSASSKGFTLNVGYWF